MGRYRLSGEDGGGGVCIRRTTIIRLCIGLGVRMEGTGRVCRRGHGYAALRGEDGGNG